MEEERSLLEVAGCALRTCPDWGMGNLQHLNSVRVNSSVANTALTASFAVTSAIFFFFAYLLKHEKHTFSLLSLPACLHSLVFDDFHLSGVNATPKQFGILFF